MRGFDSSVPTMRYGKDKTWGLGVKLAAEEASKCPVCDKLLNGATPADGVQAFPKPGDVSVCAGCLTALKFGTDLKLVKLSDEELAGEYASLAGELAAARQIVCRKRGLS